MNSRASQALLGTAALLAVLPKLVSGQASSNAECAARVPLNDVLAGKSAFFSDCGGNDPTTGCWQVGRYNQPGTDQEDTNYGCQTCVIQEDWAEDAIFPVIWSAEPFIGDGLSTCPDDPFDDEEFSGNTAYLDFYTDLYPNADIEADVVSAASVYGQGQCSRYNDAFYSASLDRCYFKGSVLARETFDGATSVCEEMGGALVAITSEEELNFVVYNMSWIGTAGEVSTGLSKYNGADGSDYFFQQSENLQFPDGLASGLYDDLWYGNEGDDTEYAAGTRSCVFVYLNLEKKLFPFECGANVPYVCELPTARCINGNTVTAECTDVVVHESPEAPVPTPAPTVDAATTAENTRTCATDVPLEDVRRGKGSFFSGCAYPNDIQTGCWLGGKYQGAPTEMAQNTYSVGCQTCVIGESWAEDSVFAVLWPADGDRDLMARCPSDPFGDDTTYEELYMDIFDVEEIDVVTAASIINDDECGDYAGDVVVYNEEDNVCYFKSSVNQGGVVANDQGTKNHDDAQETCEGMGGALVALQTEEENDFVVNNLLWVGWHGDTHTGLAKGDGEDYTWAQSDDINIPEDFVPADFSDWNDGDGPWYPPLDEEDTNIAGQPTCMVVYINIPKLFTPQSCDINLLFVCELPSASLIAGTTAAPTEPPTPAPVAETVAPTEAEDEEESEDTTPAPAAAGGGGGGGGGGGSTTAPSSGDSSDTTTAPSSGDSSDGGDGGGDDPTPTPAPAADGDRGTTEAPLNAGGQGSGSSGGGSSGLSDGEIAAIACSSAVVAGAVIGGGIYASKKNRGANVV